MLSIVLNKIFNKLISFLEIDTLILDLNYLICVPHPIIINHSIISLNMYSLEYI